MRNFLKLYTIRQTNVSVHSYDDIYVIDEVRALSKVNMKMIKETVQPEHQMNCKIKSIEVILR